MAETKYYTLENIDGVIYEIKKKLMTNDRLLKCLKFNSTDALSQPDLTMGDKALLFDEANSNCRVYSIPFNYETTDKNKSEIRIFIRNTNPVNQYLSNISICFQVIVANNLWKLDEGKQRPWVIISEILKTLNGEAIRGIGKLYFTEPFSIQMFNKSFTGYTTTVSTKLI